MTFFAQMVSTQILASLILLKYLSLSVFNTNDYAVFIHAFIYNTSHQNLYRRFLKLPVSFLNKFADKLVGDQTPKYNTLEKLILNLNYNNTIIGTVNLTSKD